MREFWVIAITGTCSGMYMCCEGVSQLDVVKQLTETYSDLESVRFD